MLSTPLDAGLSMQYSGAIGRPIDTSAPHAHAPRRAPKNPLLTSRPGSRIALNSTLTSARQRLSCTVGRPTEPCPLLLRPGCFGAERAVNWQVPAPARHPSRPTTYCATSRQPGAAERQRQGMTTASPPDSAPKADATRPTSAGFLPGEKFWRYSGVAAYSDRQ